MAYGTATGTTATTASTSQLRFAAQMETMLASKHQEQLELLLFGLFQVLMDSKPNLGYKWTRSSRVGISSSCSWK
jgi:hypothetical protein